MTQTWKLWLRCRIAAFAIAVATMVVLGSAAHSYFVQQSWSLAAGLAYRKMPPAIPLTDRISWAAHDLFGMILPYSALSSTALLVAFLIAGAVTRLSGFRLPVFCLAGALALLALFSLLKSILGTVGIFGARGPAGLAAQMAIGAIAGLLFAFVSRDR